MRKAARVSTCIAQKIDSSNYLNLSNEDNSTKTDQFERTNNQKILI